MTAGFLLLLGAAYLLGSAPTSYLAGRAARGIDLREHGSGNLGATNALRVLGWRVAAPVFVVDVAKGWVPARLFPLALPDASPELGLAFGAAAVLGHVFSVFVGFRGGKGVATGAGVFLALAPVAAVVAILAWAAVVAATRIVSAGSLVAAALVPLVIYLVQGVVPVFWMALAVAALVIVAHRANIGRLLRGEEQRVGRGTGGMA